ncbi:MAG: hydroxyacid dehydrogenase [archaeon GB-1867-035]|nr:hydroxyacid dehydrogenase [Candidatus Culexmicrobium profundum]
MGFRFLVVEPIHDVGVKLLKRFGEVTVLPPGSGVEDLKRAIVDVDAVVSRGFIKITRDVLLAAKRLKVIGVHGVGVDHIDLDAARELGVKVINTPTALTDTVAEFTIGMIISLLRRIPQADRAVRRSEWDRKFSDLVGFDLAGRIVGILGLGKIGSAVARRLKPFNVKLIYYDKVRKLDLERELEVRFRSLDDLLRESDILCIHVPLTEETYHMISYREFELMKNGVFIVNMARGAVIDEEALIEYLRKGKIGGAALDVFEVEPLPLSSPLLEFENVILTPHLGASSVDALKRMAVEVAARILEELGVDLSS